MSIRLLFIDKAFVICEKPIGISSESPGLPELVKEQINSPVYPVHRLDITTGGVCILARSASACSRLQSILQSHRAEKDYFAVIAGSPDNESGSFDDYLFHDRTKNKSFIVSKPRKGVRDAHCQWRLLESVPYEESTLSLVSIRISTGRTHQIRIQFASRGFALVGDQKYGSRIKSASPALWSARISFPHPFIQGKNVDVSSAPPAVFPWNCFTFLKS